MEWTYFVFGVIAYQIGRMLFWIAVRLIFEHRQKRFLKLVNIQFPDKKDVTFISVSSSDRETTKQLEDQLHARFDFPEQDLK